MNDTFTEVQKSDPIPENPEKEAEEIEQRQKKKWYRRRLFLVTVIGVVVASGLIAVSIKLTIQKNEKVDLLKAREKQSHRRSGEIKTQINKAINKATLAGTTWKNYCDPCGAGNKTYHVRLRSDGTFVYNTLRPDGTFVYDTDFIDDGDDTWSIEGAELKLDWSNGTSIQVYPLTDSRFEKLVSSMVTWGGQRYLERIAE